MKDPNFNKPRKTLLKVWKILNKQAKMLMIMQPKNLVMLGLPHNKKLERQRNKQAKL